MKIRFLVPRSVTSELLEHTPTTLALTILENSLKCRSLRTPSLNDHPPIISTALKSGHLALSLWSGADYPTLVSLLKRLKSEIEIVSRPLLLYVTQWIWVAASSVKFSGPGGCFSSSTRPFLLNHAYQRSCIVRLN